MGPHGTRRVRRSSLVLTLAAFVSACSIATSTAAADLPVAGATDPVTITVPGLDADWSTSEAEGEALLSPVALPAATPRKGISMPVTIESAPRRRDD